MEKELVKKKRGGWKLSEETKKRIGLAASIFMKGKKASPEARKKMSIAKKGKPTWNTSMKIDRKKYPHFGHFKKHSLATKLKISGSHKGEKNHFWKGGITPLHKKIRNTLEYKLWRRAVLERDNYTCIWCKFKGFKNSGTLNVDHIKPFAMYPELRYAIDNGRTLCLDCHRKTDSYGKVIKKND